jgi:nonribosomal peptide synthetase DhbF
LLKACEQAVENFNFHHIDVPGDEANPSLWQVVLDEMRAAKPDQQVAYRDGARLVSALEMVDWRAAPRTHHPLRDNTHGESGFCLITDGLGGIGIEVARLLLRRRNRVLLVGRSSLAARHTNDQLAELERLGPEMYQQADVTVPEDMERALAAAQAAWGVNLGGVFHLAGFGREASLLEETPQAMLPMLGPKVFGTCAIERVLAQNPRAYCVLFSSAVTTTDTSQTAAYAMANAYLDGWAAVQRQRGMLVHCFNWAPWEDLGMNAGWTVSPALRAKGLASIPVRSGLNSLLAGWVSPRLDLSSAWTPTMLASTPPCTSRRARQRCGWKPSSRDEQPRRIWSSRAWSKHETLSIARYPPRCRSSRISPKGRGRAEADRGLRPRPRRGGGRRR